MKPAGVKAIKEELKLRSREELIELCLNLSKFKKENKELLTYLLFEADDENYFIQGIKEEIKTQFEEVNRKSYYYVKKSIRKILRNTKKNIRYSKKKQTEVELILFFCKMLQEFSPSIKKVFHFQKYLNERFKEFKKLS